MQNDEKTELFEQMSVPRAVIRLSMPMILSSLTVIIYNIADTFFVGMLNDPIQNAAISLAAPIMLATNIINSLFGVGTASMMSRALGVKDYKTLKQCSAFGLYGTLCSSLLFSAVYALFKYPIMAVLGAQPETLAATDAYMFWTITLGALPTILHVVMMQIIRAEGESVFASLGVIVCVDYLAVAIFQAIGRGKEALLFAIARKILLEIPSLFLLNYLFPMYGLAYAQLVTELVLSIIAAVLLKRLFRKLEHQKSGDIESHL